MSTPDLDAIQARADAATKGPWATEPVERGRFAGIESRIYSLNGSHILLGSTDGEAGQATTANATFIASARTDVPALLAYARDLEARLKEAQDDAWELGVIHGHNAEGRLIDKREANPYRSALTATDAS